MRRLRFYFNCCRGKENHPLQVEGKIKSKDELVKLPESQGLQNSKNLPASLKSKDSKILPEKFKSDISISIQDEIKSPGDKRKKDIIPKKVREAVWIKYSGNNDIGICYVCGIHIYRYNGGWHCSHVKSDVKGGQETVENLRTCCAHCNLSMGNQNLYAYIRDKNKNGPGRLNMENYFKLHKSEINDKRTIIRK